MFPNIQKGSEVVYSNSSCSRDCSVCHSTSSNVSNLYFPSFEDSFFVLNKLFVVPVDHCVKLLGQQPSAAEVSVPVKKRLSAGDQFQLCSSCEDDFKKAKCIYGELVLAVKQFRDIQKKLATLTKEGKRHCSYPDGTETLKDPFWELFSTTADNFDDSAPFLVEDLKVKLEHITGTFQSEQCKRLEVTDEEHNIDIAATSNDCAWLEHMENAHDGEHISENSVASYESGILMDPSELERDTNAAHSEIFVKEEYCSEVDDWNTDEEGTPRHCVEEDENGSNDSFQKIDMTEGIVDDDNGKLSACSNSEEEKSQNKWRARRKVKGKRKHPPMSGSKKPKRIRKARKKLSSSATSSRKRTRACNLVANNCSKSGNDQADKMGPATEEGTEKNVPSQKIDTFESLNESEEESQHSNSEQPGVQCSKCETNCVTKRGLSIHMSRKHGIHGVRVTREMEKAKERKRIPIPRAEGKFKCPEKGCEKFFNRRYQFKIHISKHTKQPLFKCQFCEEAFYNKCTLTRHVQKFHPETVTPEEPSILSIITSKLESYECNLCSKVFKTNGAIINHKKLIHGIIEPRKERVCPEEGCGMIFKSKISLELLRNHLSKHHGWEPNYKCSKCDMAFNTWKQKWRHEDKVHGDGVSKRPFICDQCGKDFTCSDFLHTHRSLWHRQTSVALSNDSNVCDVCGKTYRTLSLLRMHMYQYHQKDKKFICDICGKEYKSSMALRGHNLLAHNPDKLKAACHLCEKKFLCRRQLENHLYHSHRFGPKEYSRGPPKKEMFRCSVTGCRKKFFGDKSKLDQHFLEIHGEDGKKPGAFKCKFCGQTFFANFKLKYHEMVHENKDSRPYICDVDNCQKGFPSPWYLQFHKTHTHKLSGVKVEHGSKRTSSATE